MRTSLTRAEMALVADEPPSGVYVLPEPERSVYLETGEIVSERAEEQEENHFLNGATPQRKPESQVHERK